MTDKVLNAEQMENIRNLIIQICVEAEQRDRITPEEKEAILDFLSNAIGLRKTMDELDEGELEE